MLTGRWEGREWEGYGGATFVSARAAPDSLHIVAAKLGKRGFQPIEYITVSVAFAGPGTYALGSGSGKVEFEEIVGGDVVSATYTSVPGTSGTLRITRYEGPGGDVEGTLSFAAVSDSPYKSYGPIGRFENGRFRVPVETRPELSPTT